MNTPRFNIFNTKINALRVIQRKPISDERGFFERLFCSEELKEITHGKEIVQINHSLSKLKGTVRGMHFQKHPYAEIKFVSCLKGKIFDVALDIRKESQTFLKYHAEILSEDNHRMLAIPEGFAHGFQALEDNCEVFYFITSPYQHQFEAGLNPIDPALDIHWPIGISEISAKDKNQNFINERFQEISL